MGLGSRDARALRAPPRFENIDIHLGHDQVADGFLFQEGERVSKRPQALIVLNVRDVEGIVRGAASVRVDLVAALEYVLKIVRR